MLLAGFGLAIDRSALGALALLVVAVVPLERRWPRHRQPWRRPGLLLDVGHALAGGLAGVALLLAAGTLALVSGVGERVDVPPVGRCVALAGAGGRRLRVVRSRLLLGAPCPARGPRCGDCTASTIPVGTSTG
ncbi:MAG: hypothetical protein R2755_13100 [Acidimicrobiales bacterium]